MPVATCPRVCLRHTYKKTTRFIERIAGLFIGYWGKTRNADLTVESPFP